MAVDEMGKLREYAYWKLTCIKVDAHTHTDRLRDWLKLGMERKSPSYYRNKEERILFLCHINGASGR
jgi:hypothetical protein